MSADIFELPPGHDMTPKEAEQYLKNGNLVPFLSRTERLFSTEPYGPELDELFPELVKVTEVTSVVPDLALIFD